MTVTMPSAMAIHFEQLSLGQGQEPGLNAYREETGNIKGERLGLQNQRR